MMIRMGFSLCPFHHMALHVAHIMGLSGELAPLLLRQSAPLVQFLFIRAGDGKRRAAALLQESHLEALRLLEFPLFILHVLHHFCVRLTVQGGHMEPGEVGRDERF